MDASVSNKDRLEGNKQRPFHNQRQTARVHVYCLVLLVTTLIVLIVHMQLEINTLKKKVNDSDVRLEALLHSVDTLAKEYHGNYKPKTAEAVSDDGDPSSDSSRVIATYTDQWTEDIDVRVSDDRITLNRSNSNNEDDQRKFHPTRSRREARHGNDDAYCKYEFYDPTICLRWNNFYPTKTRKKLFFILKFKYSDSSNKTTSPLVSMQYI